VSIADVSDESLANLVCLKGRRAIVTGGAQGLGKAIGRRLAEAGARVLLADLNQEGAHSAALELSQALSQELLSAPVDVTSSASIAQLADVGTDGLGGIDIWVNNAGIFPPSPLLETSDDSWDRVLDINLRGTFLGCREAARRMVKAGRGGVIINMTSVAGLRGISSGISSYVASKHGVCGLTSQLAIELAPHDIRVHRCRTTWAFVREPARSPAQQSADRGR
jgi:NAD(P)-dependent dehydrogenase (short-subunit alcohol dehydrogenase family)